MPLVRGKEMDSSFAKNGEGMAELKNIKWYGYREQKTLKDKGKEESMVRENRRTFIKVDCYV